MDLTVGYEELQDYINKHYRKDLTFSKVSDKEICVTYKQGILVGSVKIPLNITFEEVKPQYVTVSYNGGFGVDMIISGVLAFVRSKNLELAAALIQEPGNRIRFVFANLKKAKEVLKYLELRSITVEDNSLKISVSPK